jgi:hypothetical protein
MAFKRKRAEAMRAFASAAVQVSSPQNTAGLAAGVLCWIPALRYGCAALARE